MSQINQISELFTAALDNNVPFEKLAGVAGKYIQSHYRENAFTNGIIEQQPVEEGRLIPNDQDEGFHVLEDLEPDSVAMRINWRSDANPVYVQGKRYRVYFHTITSEKLVKSRDELRSYRIPLLKVLEANLAKDIEEQVDVNFLSHAKLGLMFAQQSRTKALNERGLFANTIQTGAGVGRLGSKWELASFLFTKKAGLLANGGGLATSTTWSGSFNTSHANYNPATGYESNIVMAETSHISRDAITAGAQILASRALKAKTFLVHQSDWEGLFSWQHNEAGFTVADEIIRDGYQSMKLGGHTFVTTLRDNPDLVRKGQMWVFPSSEFLGRNYSNGPTHFQMKAEDGPKISMQVWQSVGLGIGNVRGIGLVLLRGGSITLPGTVFYDNSNALVGSGTFTLINDPLSPIL